MTMNERHLTPAPHIVEAVEDLGFTTTRAPDIAVALRAAWEAAVPLDGHNLRVAAESDVGRALTVLATFFGESDGYGSRKNFGPPDENGAPMMIDLRSDLPTPTGN